MHNQSSRLQDRYPTCHRLMSPDSWSALTKTPEDVGESFPERIAASINSLNLPPYLGALAELEAAGYRCSQAWNHAHGSFMVGDSARRKQLNPTLAILELPWTGLIPLLDAQASDLPDPQMARETILIWLDPLNETVRYQVADLVVLTALKIVEEGVHIGEAALAYGVPVASLHRIVDQAVTKGLILSPPSRLQRDPAFFPLGDKKNERFSRARVFTLQWHITQACDLHCRHCYDRTDRGQLTPKQAHFVLDELERFCRSRQVRAKVTFTGGNPLLYPHFDDLYLETVKRGFPVSILGNPASKQRLERLVAIQTPMVYQLSLEGLREHNDYIRQEGYFDRVMAFLPLLRELGVPSQVMLTLTRENMDQVLPLGHALRGLTDMFTFNRLSAVGQGAALLMPSPEDYQAFLRDYLRQCQTNSVLGLKDNLINIIRAENGKKPFGGCTGFGCGAAFNFLTLLSDGDVHACRKFPSPLGNIFEQGLEACYGSPAGTAYRAGSAACQGCQLFASCGGCQAVVSSLGLDPHVHRDPYCFFTGAPKHHSGVDLAP